MRKEGKLNINLNGSLSDRRSKRELDSLLFAINDYIDLREQPKKKEMMVTNE